MIRWMKTRSGRRAESLPPRMGEKKGDEWRKLRDGEYSCSGLFSVNQLLLISPYPPPLPWGPAVQTSDFNTSALDARWWAAKYPLSKMCLLCSIKNTCYLKMSHSAAFITWTVEIVSNRRFKMNVKWEFIFVPFHGTLYTVHTQKRKTNPTMHPPP